MIDQINETMLLISIYQDLWICLFADEFQEGFLFINYHDNWDCLVFGNSTNYIYIYIRTKKMLMLKYKKQRRPNYGQPI